MNEHRCDGRVAVVTGAGRGIGRAYARLLAERGPSVVVNDLGGSMGGDGADPAPAEPVVADIIAAGGTAVPDDSDVSDDDGAPTLVGTAPVRFGRVVGVVTTAGTLRSDRLTRTTLAHPRRPPP